MIELRGSYTWRDSYRVFLLSSRPRRAWAIVGAILLAALVWALYISWADFLRNGRGSPGALTYGSIVLVLLFGVYYPIAHYRAYKRSKSLSAPVTILLDDEAIAFSQEHLSARYLWPQIIAARENRHLYLLYNDAGPAVAIPKRFADDASQSDSLRAMLRARQLVV